LSNATTPTRAHLPRRRHAGREQHGDLGAITSPLYINGGTLDETTAFSFGSRPIIFANQTNFTVGANQTQTLAFPPGGSSPLVMNGPGTLILGSPYAATYSGGTVVNGGPSR